MGAMVECHSGHEYAERPVTLWWLGERLEIAEILARWRTPKEKCFRVRTVDEQVFELFYDEISGEWQIRQP